MRTNYITSLIIIILFFPVACKGGAMNEDVHHYKNIGEVPESVWMTLSEKKIYFGHQSVGFNIIKGMKDIMAEYPDIKLNIVETHDSKDFSSGVFAHSRVGQNLDTKIKINDFTKVLDDGVGRKADAAMLKFCYLDMTKNTDVAKVFGEYHSAVDQVRQNYPDLTIIHVTEPLTVSETNWKTWIKKVIGKKDFWEFDDNIQRNRYNRLLKKEYEGRDPIFDLARIESTNQDGTRKSFTLHGVTYYSMVPEYTRDGGHLNEIGRKVVAEQLLLFLANRTQ